jgi:hypothetical protein
MARVKLCCAESTLDKIVLMAACSSLDTYPENSGRDVSSMASTTVAALNIEP